MNHPKKGAAAKQAPQESQSQYTTPSLFDHGQHAAETRAAALAEAAPKQSARQQLALILLRKAGERGHTRESLGEAMGLKVQSACPVALALLRAGQAIETGERRKTSSGSWAAVIVANGCTGGDKE